MADGPNTATAPALQLPPGYEDAKPQAQVTPGGTPGTSITWANGAKADPNAAQPKVTLPSGYEDAKPVATATPSWYDHSVRFLQSAWDQLSPTNMVKGAAQFTAHPYDTYMQDASARQEAYGKAEAALKSGDYGAAALHALYGTIPLWGPGLESAASKLSNDDISGGLGQTVGMGLSAVAPEYAASGVNSVITALREPTAQLGASLYQRVLKPPPTTPGVPDLVNTALDNSIVPSTSGAAKLDTLVDNYRNAVMARIQGGIPAQPGLTAPGQVPPPNVMPTINPLDVLQRMNRSLGTFSTQVTPNADLNALGNVGQEFLENNTVNGQGVKPIPIRADRAQALKTGTYTQLGEKYGELSNAEVEGQKDLARGLKEEIENLYPEVKGLNAKEGDLLELKPVLMRAITRIDNHNPIGLTTAIIGAGAGTAGAVAGGAEGAGAGLGTALLYRVMSDPAVQSRIAIGLYKASKGAVTIPMATARTVGYVNALGNMIEKQGGDSRQHSEPTDLYGALPWWAARAAQADDGEYNVPLVQAP